MGIAGKLAKRLAKAVEPETEGQKKVKKATKGQRAYARGQMKGAAAGATGAAALAGLGITELRARLKEAETEKERADIKAAIEKTLREMSEEEKTMKGDNTRGTSPKPKLRPKEMSKGGKVKKYAKGGYANCGASMKPTQKSTNMAYGGMARKK
jgi:hypothetical protein